MVPLKSSGVFLTDMCVYVRACVCLFLLFALLLYVVGRAYHGSDDFCCWFVWFGSKGQPLLRSSEFVSGDCRVGDGHVFFIVWRFYNVYN